MAALAGLVYDGRLTPTVAATESLPADAAQSAKTGPGRPPHPRLTRAHPPPVLRKEFTVTCAMRHPVAPAQQVRHGANEVRSWLS